MWSTHNLKNLPAIYTAEIIDIIFGIGSERREMFGTTINIARCERENIVCEKKIKWENYRNT